MKEECILSIEKCMQILAKRRKYEKGGDLGIYHLLFISYRVKRREFSI